MVKKNYISVLLPVYNAEKFLAETLDSLLRQTYKEFEIIAVNDGSTDGSLAILEEYAARDQRIVIVSRKNKGLVKTLNEAAQLASGEYLARIDSDDIALPKRFELQIAAINDSPDRVLIGGSFDVINEDGEILYHDAVPTDFRDLLNAFRVRNPLAHGSVLIRKKAFEKAGGYSENCGPTEDYDLWVRLAKIGEIIAIKNTIFRWRVNSTGITSTQSKTMEKFMKKNLDSFWAENPYRLVSRKSLLSRGANYVSVDTIGGIAMKEAVFHDVTEISLALVKRGAPLKGLAQLLLVALTGRTGFRIVSHRLRRMFRYHLLGR